MPVVSIFSNRAGIGKTSLVYHLAWMASLLGHRVLTVDLDPQAALTSAFLEPEQVEVLWGRTRQTIYGSLRSTVDGSAKDLTATSIETSHSASYFSPAHIEQITTNLHLIVGDIALANIEHQFSSIPSLVSALAAIISEAEKQTQADLVLIDLGPSLDSLCRAALIASDHIVVPVAPDLYSIEGLRRLGPTLSAWQAEWQQSLGAGQEMENRSYSQAPALTPPGHIGIGSYVVLHQPARLDRIPGSSERWMANIPREFRNAFPGAFSDDDPLVSHSPAPNHPNADEHCLGLVKQFQSLMHMGREARKPVFLLKSADGAIGAHQQAVTAAYISYKQLTERFLSALS